MLDRIVTKLIDYQIARGILKENDRKLYQYGYLVVFEYIINVLAAVFIAAIFRAYGIVIVFTLSFMLVRSYVGGYHAKSGAICFVMSVTMQILVILAVRNKSISDNERKIFRKKAKVIYVLELIICFCFIGLDKMRYTYSILGAYLIIFALVMINNAHKHKSAE